MEGFTRILGFHPNTRVSPEYTGLGPLGPIGYHLGPFVTHLGLFLFGAHFYLFGAHLGPWDPFGGARWPNWPYLPFFLMRRYGYKGPGTGRACGFCSISFAITMASTLGKLKLLMI